MKVVAFDPETMVWNPKHDDASFMITSALTEDGSEKLVVLDDRNVLAAASYYITVKKTMGIDWFGSISSGAGTKLMNALVEIAKKKHLKSIFTSSVQTADSFYGKFGFESNQSKTKPLMIKNLQETLTFKQFILIEVLDTAYEFKLRNHVDGVSASFKNTNGDKVIVSFVGYHIPEIGWSYEISFGINDNNELTGKGDEFKTFGTVLAIVDAFMEKKKSAGRPVLLFCTANSSTRQKLYIKLVRRIASKYPSFKVTNPVDLPKNVQDWWKQLDFDGENVIIASAL